MSFQLVAERSWKPVVELLTCSARCYWETAQEGICSLSAPVTQLTVAVTSRCSVGGEAPVPVTAPAPVCGNSRAASGKVAAVGRNLPDWQEQTE